MTKQEVYEQALVYLEEKRKQWQAPENYWYHRAQVVSDTICLRDWLIDFFIEGYRRALPKEQQLFHNFTAQTINTDKVTNKQTGPESVVQISQEDAKNNFDSLSCYKHTTDQ